MSTNVVSDSVVSPSLERFTGRVKWFNNKAGFGFITVTDGSRSGTDIFVHHTSIKVDSEQYKYLVQGEYVAFTLVSSSRPDLEFQADGVCGINGGKLMCETRHESRIARSHYRSSRLENSDASGQENIRPRAVAAPTNNKTQHHSRARPREEGEWSYVAQAKKRADKSNDAETKSRQTQRATGARGRGRPPKTTGRETTTTA